MSTEKQQSNTSTNALKSVGKEIYSKITKIEPIVDTMFTLVIEETGEESTADELDKRVTFIAVGNDRVSETTTYGACVELLKLKPWKLIEMLVLVIVKALNEQKMEIATKKEEKEGTKND